ncbi:MAG: efflux RND transporter periplasmic adaptor subunit [Myxococcales bacterium]|nr:efflux RND transporter periplasmic adaptor subunit [Myxococcales bacterium]
MTSSQDDRPEQRSAEALESDPSQHGEESDSTTPDDDKPTEPDAPRADVDQAIPRSISTKRLLLIIAGLLMVMYVGALVGPTIGSDAHAVWSKVAGSKEEAEGPGGQHYYTCGMHPWVIVPKPGDCPICGMKLVPLDPSKFSGEVSIDPVVSQNIGVRVEKVAEGSESGSIRTVGTVTYDEKLLGDVNVKVGGWIEKLFVDYQGKPVKRGQALFSLYSPELYAAQGEYLLAYKATKRIKGAEEGQAVGGLASELLGPARTKLSLFDIGSGQIKALEKRGKPFRTMTITSPQSGVVIEKNAFEGMKVTPGMTAYRIADLSRVWVMATIYEYQSQQIKVGQKATMTLTYLPGETLEGKVVYVYPYLDERTRQINVRLEFDNPDLKLKPGMYATVVFQGTATDKRVLVSRSAVIDTGERQVAFVAKGQGRFEPRQVKMGAETADGKVEILEGLKPGDLVVVSGQFLIDSEARMREALAKMMKGTPVAEATTPEAPAVETTTLVLPDAANKALGTALDGYLAIGKALAGDTTTDIGVSARSLAEALDALLAMSIPNHPHFWHEHPEAANAKEQAEELAKVKSLDDARRKFSVLSNQLSKLLHATGIPKAYGKKLGEAHCPMYPEGEKGGAVWIQAEGTVKNPFFGKAMLSCADWQRPLKVAK